MKRKSEPERIYVFCFQPGKYSEKVSSPDRDEVEDWMAHARKRGYPFLYSHIVEKDGTISQWKA